MIDFDSYPIFQKNKTTLKKTSLDNRDNKKIYMTQSDMMAVDFDNVKNEYVKNLYLDPVPKSNDALILNLNGKIVFVEFKNGCVDRNTQFGIRKKIYDSSLIYCDITSQQISNMRKNVDYILVYNEKVNSNNTTDPELMKKHQNNVQPSVAFDCLAKQLSQYANEEYICFGLKMFKNYCFHEVHTFTENEFENYLNKIIKK